MNRTSPEPSEAAAVGAERIPPAPVVRPSSWTAERRQAAFGLGAAAAVFGTVFLVPLLFLGGRPTDAPPAAAVPTSVLVRLGIEPETSAAAGTPAAEGSALSDADINAVAEDEEAAPETPPPPPRTIAEVCRSLPGYGTRFVYPDENDASIRVVDGRFGRRTFYELLQQNTRDVAALGDIQRAVKDSGLFDFRRIQPDHRFRLFVDGDGRLRLFEYATSETEMFHVVPAVEGGFAVHRINVPIETRLARAAGRVESSFAQALTAAGLRGTIVPLVTDIFSYAFSFAQDVRRGDRFRLVVEERWIGGEFSRYNRVLAFEFVGAVVGTVRAYAFDVDGRARYFDRDGNSMQRVFLSAPCRYDAVSSRFDPNRMHPVLHRRMPHTGIDLVGPTGTPIYAIADGRVAFHGEKGPNGNLVIVDHGEQMLTYYAHLDRYAEGLRDGMRVRKGQLVGYMGNTGRSTGPHLHFAIKRRGEWVDPEPYIRSQRDQPIPAARRTAFQARVAELERELARVDLPAGNAPAPPPAEPEVGLAPDAGGAAP
jgi:murein DD-endopeptidase MepM/ murein hydrolase activator NlpD